MANKPMSEQALRLGPAQLARSLRRVNPGVQFAFVRPGERLNRSAAPARAWKVRRPGAFPENERTVAHRRGMATATLSGYTYALRRRKLTGESSVR